MEIITAPQDTIGITSASSKNISMFSFRLTDDFLDSYRGRVVPFGYRDAAGNSVGEITFLRTYSRLKEDGTKETWADVCERVINGMYSLQKDHCKKSRLPWNDVKAQASAKEAFDRLFTLKWTPPGRGLWVMGTNIVNIQKNSAALQNCFSGTEKFITREYGAVPFLDTLGETVTVYTQDGWKQATVNSFGSQSVQRVTFAPAMSSPVGEGFRSSRSNHRVDVVVTPEHRWVLPNGDITTSLSVGDTVPALATVGDKTSEDYTEGLQHGLIFGDGTAGYHYADGSREYHIRLCGDKAQSYVGIFDNVNLTVPSYNGDPWCRLRGRVDFKDFPTVGASVDYLNGFLEGWIAADGTRGVQEGAFILTSQHVGAKEWLENNSATSGFLLRGVNMDSCMETNFGVRKNAMYRYTLLPKPSFWKVTSIELLEEPEEVYCATVDGAAAFTLSSGIYTGNCAFVSTAEMSKYAPAKPFAFLMEASMLGVGVGFDDKGADKDFTINAPTPTERQSSLYVIPDTREGWVESVVSLLNSYLKPDQKQIHFDYSEIRPLGALIKTFGGTASGPAPLIKLHNSIDRLFNNRGGEKLTRRDIADIGNLIGVCVVSGNVRRSAELLIGRLDDKDFLNLKNSEVFPERNSYNPDSPGWGWMSNNSVETSVGQDLSAIVEGIALNGEPGVIWLDVSRKYGRLADPVNNKDWRVAGYNPCAEQSLESYECCTLVETYLNRHESLDDYKRTLKFAYLYAKTVTLLPTHWEETNAIMQRNRRIGASMSGVADFADINGLPILREWMDQGYKNIQRYDNIYSEWLGVRESIKMTTIKPSGTVSILAGESPGVHWTPGGKFFNRTIRFSNDDPMLPLFRMANYKVEPASESPDTTSVVYFPIESKAKRSEKDVTIFEKISLAAAAQRYWSDNSVSVTVSFNAETERQHVGTVLHMYDGQLKTVSFLPSGNETYLQMPYTQITEEEYKEGTMKLFPIDFSGVYAGMAADAIGESYCTTDSCEIKFIKDNVKN